jgi:hypothetical protein
LFEGEGRQSLEGQIHFGLSVLTFNGDTSHKEAIARQEGRALFGAVGIKKV